MYKLTERAHKIVDAGMRAFRSTHVRPDKGHTNLKRQKVYRPGKDPAVGVLHFACVVGAMAHEAKLLNAARIGDVDETIVARYFAVDENEVGLMEQGFDSFFHVRDSFERKNIENDMDSKQEFWQVGWAVAKKATEHYTELDKAENEAWVMHERRHFANKDWLDIAMEDNAIELDKYRLWLARKKQKDLTPTPDGAA